MRHDTFQVFEFKLYWFFQNTLGFFILFCAVTSSKVEEMIGSSAASAIWHPDVFIV